MSPPDPTYTLKNMHPNSSMPTLLPSATIYLGGLLCLAFDKETNNLCTVGANSAGGHNWQLRVREHGTTIPVLTLDKTSIPPGTSITIKVTGGTTGPGGTNGALVYTGPDVTVPSGGDRYNLLESWVDMEGIRGHKKPVAHDAGKLSPRFYIEDGLFCAFRLSTGQWMLEDTQTPTTNKVLLGKVALAIAADIFLQPSGSIEIIYVGGPFKCHQNKRYDIYITNNCERLCDLSSIDFIDHYTAFKAAFPGTYSDAEKFNLVRTDTIDGTCNPIFPDGIGYGKLTDRAPCMSVTVGGTTTIN